MTAELDTVLLLCVVLWHLCAFFYRQFYVVDFNDELLALYTLCLHGLFICHLFKLSSLSLLAVSELFSNKYLCINYYQIILLFR